MRHFKSKENYKCIPCSFNCDKCAHTENNCVNCRVNSINGTFTPYLDITNGKCVE